MKLRYTPLQIDVVSVESPESPSHDVMQTADDLGGMPVVCCGLHSQVPLVAAAIKSVDPECRVVYCMTDAASLPLPLSERDQGQCRRGARGRDDHLRAGVRRRVRGGQPALRAPRGTPRGAGRRRDRRDRSGRGGHLDSVRARGRGAGRGDQRRRGARRDAAARAAAVVRRHPRASPRGEPPHALRAHAGRAGAQRSSRCPRCRRTRPSRSTRRWSRPASGSATRACGSRSSERLAGPSRGRGHHDGPGPTDDPAFFAACFAAGAAAVDVARGLSDDSVRTGAAPDSGESA